MHACGHDGHTAALLGTAQTLSKFREYVKGTVIFIFQHAEELPPGGAKFMIEENVLDEWMLSLVPILLPDYPLEKSRLGKEYKWPLLINLKL